jgi:hypothetical protein
MGIWREHVHPKRRYIPTGLDGVVTSQNITNWRQMATDISRQPALTMSLRNMHATALVIRGITHGFERVLRIAGYSEVQKRSCTLQQTDKKYHKGGHLPYSRDGKHRWRFNWLLCHMAISSSAMCSNILLERPLNFIRQSFLLYLHASFHLSPLFLSYLSPLKLWTDLHF